MIYNRYFCIPVIRTESDMKVVRVTEKEIKRLLNSLTVKEDLLTIFNNLVVKFYNNYVEFLYIVFTSYMRNYVRLLDECPYLNQEEIEQIVDKLKNLKKEINVEDIHIVDIYDLLFRISFYDPIDNIQFKYCLYDDIYDRLKNLLNENDAYIYLESVIDIIEHLTISIENSLVSISEHFEDNEDNIIFYIDTHKDSLLFIVI